MHNQARRGIISDGLCNEEHNRRIREARFIPKNFEFKGQTTYIRELKVKVLVFLEEEKQMLLDEAKKKRETTGRERKLENARVLREAVRARILRLKEKRKSVS